MGSPRRLGRSPRETVRRSGLLSQCTIRAATWMKSPASAPPGPPGPRSWECRACTAAPIRPVWESSADAPATARTSASSVKWEIFREPSNPEMIFDGRDGPAVHACRHRTRWPATWTNAINSVAGSHTRLNRSSNRRPGSAASNRCRPSPCDRLSRHRGTTASAEDLGQELRPERYAPISRAICVHWV